MYRESKFQNQRFEISDEYSRENSENKIAAFLFCDREREREDGTRAAGQIMITRCCIAHYPCVHAYRKFRAHNFNPPYEIAMSVCPRAFYNIVNAACRPMFAYFAHNITLFPLILHHFTEIKTKQNKYSKQKELKRWDVKRGHKCILLIRYWETYSESFEDRRRSLLGRFREIYRNVISGVNPRKSFSRIYRG